MCHPLPLLLVTLPLNCLRQCSKFCSRSNLPVVLLFMGGIASRYLLLFSPRSRMRTS